jgi:hypothetical protein
MPRHLRAVLDEYAAHYNRHRPHRSRNLRPPGAAQATPPAITDLTTAKIRRRRALGGLINEYERGHEDHQSIQAPQIRDQDRVLEPYTLRPRRTVITLPGERR